MIKILFTPNFHVAPKMVSSPSKFLWWKGIPASWSADRATCPYFLYPLSLGSI